MIATVDRTAHHDWEQAAIKAMGVKHTPAIHAIARLAGDDSMTFDLAGMGGNWAKRASLAVYDQDLTEDAEATFGLMESAGFVRVIGEQHGKRWQLRTYALTVPQPTEDGDR